MNDEEFADEYEEVVVTGAIEGEPEGPGIWICTRCQETGQGPTPDECPACGAPGETEIRQL